MNNIGLNTLNNSKSERLLHNIISSYNLQSRITDRIEYCGEWVENEPQAHKNVAWFHLVESGTCYMDINPLKEQIELSEGDLVVFPYGSAHALCGEKSKNAVLLCGEFEFDGHIATLLIQSLPSYILVKKDDTNHTLKMISQLLKYEAKIDQFGGRSVINKLADALFVIALRQHLNSGVNCNGLLAALRDPKLCDLLWRLHEEPGTNWTVEQMAEMCYQSKSAFVLHFNNTLGMPPVKYLHMLKMTEAFKMLKNPRNNITTISEKLGFANESSFRKCFKIFHGVAPGFFRKNYLE